MRGKCGKVCYPSRGLAEAFKLSYYGKTEYQRSYWCRQCKCWHLTTKRPMERRKQTREQS